MVVAATLDGNPFLACGMRLLYVTWSRPTRGRRAWGGRVRSERAGFGRQQGGCGASLL